MYLPITYLSSIYLLVYIHYLLSIYIIYHLPIYLFINQSQLVTHCSPSIKCHLLILAFKVIHGPDPTTTTCMPQVRVSGDKKGHATIRAPVLLVWQHPPEQLRFLNLSRPGSSPFETPRVLRVCSQICLSHCLWLISQAPCWSLSPLLPRCPALHSATVAHGPWLRESILGLRDFAPVLLLPGSPFPCPLPLCSVRVCALTGPWLPYVTFTPW